MQFRSIIKRKYECSNCGEEVDYSFSCKYCGCTCNYRAFNLINK